MMTIQFESHSNELAAVLEYENDPDCLEFYDQPQPSIPLEYVAKNGRRLHVFHTADFFVWDCISGLGGMQDRARSLALAEQSRSAFERLWMVHGIARRGKTSRADSGFAITSGHPRNGFGYRRNLEFLEIICAVP